MVSGLWMEGGMTPLKTGDIKCLEDGIRLLEDGIRLSSKGPLEGSIMLGVFGLGGRRWYQATEGYASGL